MIADRSWAKARIRSPGSGVEAEVEVLPYSRCKYAVTFRIYG